ncbi:hypothetical protein [Paenibacillus thalictri]|uniref:hypothetical protein n=1 Tax=Paenibacillus thalictri TaxID=2527873 RepID=UPI0013EF07D9|nr:hypothetical protein [Paenibacillus thalictri]
MPSKHIKLLMLCFGENSLQDGSYQIRQLYMEQDTIRSIIFEDLQIPMEKLFTLQQD